MLVVESGLVFTDVAAQRKFELLPCSMAFCKKCALCFVIVCFFCVPCVVHGWKSRLVSDRCFGSLASSKNPDSRLNLRLDRWDFLVNICHYICQVYQHWPRWPRPIACPFVLVIEVYFEGSIHRIFSFVGFKYVCFNSDLPLRSIALHELKKILKPK